MVDRVLPYVKRGALTVVQGPSPFEEFLPISYENGFLIAFRCVKCEEEFQLGVAKWVFEFR